MKKVTYTSQQNNMSEDVLLIDSKCGLCTRGGKFITKRQVKPLKILELKSKKGIELVQKHDIQIDSMILIKGGTVYAYSAAAIRCLKYLKWNWRWMFPFAWVIPLPLRDLGYKILAKNRHKFFRNK